MNGIETELEQTGESAVALRDGYPESRKKARWAGNSVLAYRLHLYRRLVPIPIAVVLLVIFPPQLSGDPSIDVPITAIGFLLCATGQSLRLWAWGSNPRTEQAPVRERGAYALMRHPLYAGNFLIVAGLTVTHNNPMAYVLLLAPFAFVYHLITRTEEQSMMRRFPTAYEQYMARSSSRFLPVTGNLAGALQTTFPFTWNFAWCREYPSCCAWLAGLAGLELYKQMLAYGWTLSWSTWLCVGVIFSSGTHTLILRHRKQRAKIVSAAWQREPQSSN
jgi:protein-S-isoprenylcysteine O-methyltransferase Ste14